MKHKMITIMLLLLWPVCVLVLRSIVSFLNLFPPVLFPSIPEVTQAFLSLGSQRISYEHILATLVNAWLGWIIAVIVWISLGLVLGWYPKLYAIRKSIIHFFRTLPATALFPIFLLFFGINDTAKIWIAAFVTIWIVMIATIDGVQQWSKIRYDGAKILWFKGFSLFRYVIFFEALSSILIGMKTALSMSFIVVIVVEVFVWSQFGIGQ